MAIKSILKLGIDALEETDKIKGQSLPNAFKKMGVKEEELKFANLDIDPNKTYTKAELQELEAGRVDKFDEVTPDPSYQWVSLPNVKTNPTYKERVYTFKEDGEGSRYTSEHFPDVPNYLMHTRVHDDTINGKPTRVIQEIQSDLHQTARTQGGYNIDVPVATGEEMQDARRLAELEELGELEGTMTNADDLRMDELLTRFGYTPERMEELDMPIYEALTEIGNGMNAGPSMIPETPYQKSWLAKGIEREIASAIQDGRQQIAIPIKGEGIEGLKRAEGVQRWYETQVVNTAKKIAKQQGMDFELTPTIRGETKVIGSLDNLEMNFIIKGYERARKTEGPEVAYDTALDALHNVLQARNPPEHMLDDVLIAMLEGKSVREVNEMLTTRPEKVTQYAIIRPKGEPTKGFNLYSTPAAGVGAAYLALKAGKDPRAELEAQGYDKEDIEEMLLDAQAVNQAVTDGVPFQEVMDYLQSQEPQIETVIPVEDQGFFERRRAHMEELTRLGLLKDPVAESWGVVTTEGDLSAQELLTHLQVIQPNMSSIATRISGAMGNNDDYVKAQSLLEAGNQRILDLAKERGVDLIWQPAPRPGTIEQLAGHGKFYLNTPDGPKELTPDVWEAIKSEKGELIGAVTGGVAGAKYGASLATRAGAKHPGVVGLASFTGSLLGAATGAIGGTEFDYLASSIELQEALSAEIVARKALTAGEASIIGDFVGWHLAKFGGIFWDGIVRTKNLLMDGNTVGAKKALTDMMFVTEEEAIDVVQNLRKATQDDLITDTKTAVDYQGVEQVVSTPPRSRLSEEEETIRAMVLTQPGGEEILRASGTIDPQAGRAVAKAIDDRAKDVLKSTAELTDENIGRILVDDLSNYTSDVKKFYSDVKEQVAKSPNINGFEFDYDKLALDPIMETLEKNITDPTVLEKFILQSKRIKGMSDSRTLTDLIELRQLVNDFKFNKRITKAKDFNVLNNTLSDIDGAIKQGANIVMEKPSQWLSDFALAKSQYAKMKGLERNVIARALSRPGISEESVVKALGKYVTDIDGTFQEVMSKLPMKSRKLTEGAVINNLARKYTDGTEGGLNVINFPELANDLDLITFTTPDARKAKAALKRMAEVFKNDIQLADSTGHIQIPKFQSYLTANPVVRAQFEIASSVFNRIKQLSPTKAGANAALVLRTAELLEKPLNSKLMKEVMEEVADDTNLSKKIIEMQQETARLTAQGKDPVAPKVNLYGSGDTLTVKGTGKPSEQIAMHRIATYEIRKQVADTYGIGINDTKRLDQYLIREGYLATQQGTDKVRRLK